MKIIKTIPNTILLVLTFFAAGYLQQLILQSDTRYVYIGMSIAVWGAIWYILYSSIIGTLVFLLWTVEKK